MLSLLLLVTTSKALVTSSDALVRVHPSTSTECRGDEVGEQVVLPFRPRTRRWRAEREQGQYLEKTLRFLWRWVWIKIWRPPPSNWFWSMVLLSGVLLEGLPAGATHPLIHGIFMEGTLRNLLWSFGGWNVSHGIREGLK